MSPPNSHSHCRHAPHGGVGSAVSATTATRAALRDPLADRLEHGHALGADRQAVAGALAVAAGDDAAVGRLQGGADQELRERRRARLPAPPGRRRSVVAFADRSWCHLLFKQHAGDGGVEQRGEEADEQRPAAEPGQVVPPLRGHRADAAELDADRREVGEAGQGERGQLVRALGS